MEATKVFMSKRKVPLWWIKDKKYGDKNLLFEFNIRMPESRLMAKVLVFETLKAMRAYWGKVLNQTATRAVGVCSTSPYGIRRNELELDPRFFCIIGLVRKRLHMDVIGHESVHAACDFARRRGKLNHAGVIHDNPEECICYPAGWIIEAIMEAIMVSSLPIRPYMGKVGKMSKKVFDKAKTTKSKLSVKKRLT